MSSDEDVTPIVEIGGRTGQSQIERVSSHSEWHVTAAPRQSSLHWLTSDDKVATVETLVLGRICRRVILTHDRHDRELSLYREMERSLLEWQERWCLGR